MRYLILILFINIVNINLFAQDSLKSIKETKLLLKYSPFSLFGDYMTPSTGIQIGAEFMIAKKWSIQQDFDYIYKLKNKDTTSWTFPFYFTIKTLKGFRTDTEIKYYLGEKSLYGFYTSLHILYQYTEATKNLKYYCKNDYTVYKNIIGIHGKIGYQVIIGKKTGLVIDMAIGPGIRFLKTKTFNYDLPKNRISENVRSTFYPYDDCGYEIDHRFITRLSFSGSLKIGFAI